jgi:hypothetical protein
MLDDEVFADTNKDMGCALRENLGRVDELSTRREWSREAGRRQKVW